MIAGALLVTAAAAWTTAFHGVPVQALPFLAVVVAAAGVAEVWGGRHAGTIRDLAALGGGLVAVALVPACLPLAVAVAALVVGQPGPASVAAVLASTSLVLLGQRDTPPAGFTAASAGLTVAVLAGLALEAWRRVGARRALRPLARWLVAPAVAAAVLGLPVALPLAERPLADLPVRPPDRVEPDPQARGLAATTGLGLARDLQLEANLVARFDPGLPLPPGTVYVRAQTLPVCDLAGPRLRWRAGDDTPRPWTPPTAAPGGWLERHQGGGDAVWRPDGATWAGLDYLHQDDAGNWYRPGLGFTPIAYAVGAPTAPGEPGALAEAEAVAQARRYPADLARLPWDQVESRAWGALTPRAAADAISAVLADRCQYALTGLPAPAPGPAGGLERFLFDPDPGTRRGHCQYFATAATLLLRRAGHPARVVVGFASDERTGTVVIIRGSHAHAWIEVAEAGHWYRWDPTPALPRQAATARLTLPEGSPPRPIPVVPPPAPRNLGGEGPEALPSGSGSPPGVTALVVVLVLAVLVVVGVVVASPWRRAGRRAERRARAAEEALIALARDLGLRVTPRTTLTDLVKGLERRSGLDLGPHLREHLAARYGHGPPARPWPLEDLRRASGTTRA